MDREKSVKLANDNRAKLISCFPSSLSKKEEKLYIKLAKANCGPERKLESLYRAMDEIFSFVYSYTPCKKGCTSCCHYKVSISDIEASYIEKNEKKRKLKQYKASSKYHGSKCPFLVDDSCSIYQSRPFACRNHVMLSDSNYWCHPDRCNDQEFPMVGFSEVKKSYDLIRLESNSLEQYDIRQLFE